ncbi:MAG TPA: DNA helicase RecQ, partial [Anaerolineales bacterium]|nr:DNA helicase RecQ [Anaerolineales bacterium]
MLTPAEVLKNTFGYDEYRSQQQPVIDNIMAGRDTLAIMPTGGGKSLCYQIPAILFDGLTVVVSPLIALMKDQVEQLRSAGVPAVFLNSTLSPYAYQENMEAVRSGEVKLLYLAPETLLTPRIFALLDSVRISLLTIDEAHCISEWGHDFRPEYRQLVTVRKRYPKAICLALTATATARVRADIKSTLSFTQSNEFVASFDRPNLYIEVRPKTDAVRQTLRFLDRYKDQSGIIYCFSRKQVDDLAATLVKKGYSARPYHAGLEDEQRRANQDAFIRDDAQIIVATIAFGMGINKPNVRFVLHYDLPKSIEGYYQEIGRAGRDGLPAHCLLLYSYSDVAKQRYFILQKEGDERRSAQQHLDAIIHYAEDESICRRKPLLKYFDEPYPAEKCGACDNCIAAPPVFIDITIPAQKFLSCVKRCGERFGAGHVIDILRGSKGERVLRLEHDKLSTYGIGLDLSEKQWMALAHQLVQQGYLIQDGEFRTLSLTPKATDALRRRSPITGQPLERTERRTLISIESGEVVEREEKIALPQIETNNALLAQLRAKRKQMADEAGVPPYVIFSDKTLVEMAAYYPQSPQSLL